MGNPVCPFCPFSDPDIDFVAHHVQYCHPENESRAGPEILSHIATGANQDNHLSALPGRSEQSNAKPFINARDPKVNLVDGDHLQSEHAFLAQAHTQDQSAAGVNSLSSEHWVERLRMNSKKPLYGNTRKLSRAELGPYAHEKKMPSWLLRMLDQGNPTIKMTRITPDGRLARHTVFENQALNVVSALAQLCGQDKSVQRAFLCSAHVHHIFKMPREGGFCGYRNIQMLVSYIQESRSHGSEHFPGPLPTILQLQDMIERAWDEGFNSMGRLETGGIKGTRKFIGTSEAQALFLSLGVQCEASIIGKSKEMPAHSFLLSHVAAYFRGGCPPGRTEKVVLTNLPPIYLQHQGHSMTIVGLEIREQGKANLLVFDPAFKTPSAIKHAIVPKIKTSEPARILKGYRKGANYLQKYQAFELLKLLSPGIPPCH